MKSSMKFKIGIDFVMTVLLLCQMTYLLIGETAHEWMGVAMFILFILHHALNWRWYRNLVKGRYTGVRILQITVNFLVLISMLGLMVSGIILSREAFAFLPIQGGLGFARTLHMLAAYWGFIFMSSHLGLHWGMIMGIVRNIRHATNPASYRTWVLRLLALAVCGFGIYAFCKHNIADYLFLRSHFVFFDVEQPLALFLGEYLSIMGLWVCLTYYVAKLLQACSHKQDFKKAGKRA